MNKDDKWVIKAGSSLVSGNHEGVNIDFISQLASQIDFLRKNNQEVIIISSGAVAKGMNDLGLEKDLISWQCFRLVLQLVKEVSQKFTKKPLKSLVTLLVKYS